MSIITPFCRCTVSTKSLPRSAAYITIFLCILLIINLVWYIKKEIEKSLYNYIMSPASRPNSRGLWLAPPLRRPPKGQILYDQHSSHKHYSPHQHIIWQTSVCDYNFIVHQTCVTTLKYRPHKGRYCWIYTKSGHVGYTLFDHVGTHMFSFAKL